MNTKFTPLPFTSVSIEDEFWSPRIRANREQTIPHILQQCRATGRLDAFRLKWRPGMQPTPHIFWDSDIAKWIEAASCSIAAHPDPKLELTLDEVIALVASAQQPDGYLNTYYTAVEPGKRWTNLRDCHELYCAGHLMEAAAAHYQATGKRTLLDPLCRYADRIGKVFGARPGQKRGYPGHEEIELALVKLYRATGERRYLELSRYFIDERGRMPHYFDLEAQARGEDPREFWAKTYAYMQAHLPVRGQPEPAGHAVRAMYLYSAMADLAGESGDGSLLEACERLWNHLCTRKMYITGGLGSARRIEGFGADYDLPNEAAYAETCAAVGLVFWNHRMLQQTCDSRYADGMERALYNGVLSGVSLDGVKFFYDNPLASAGSHHRQPWFECACCPPNLARLLASLGEYVYSRRETEIAVHLYAQGSCRFPAGGQNVTLIQKTRYPREGSVTLQFELERPAQLGLRLRIPGWCRTVRLSVNGEPIEVAPRLERGYARLDRTWRPDDRVQLELDMPIERIHAHPDVGSDAGRTALQRGPIVYCLEGADHDPPLQRIALPSGAPLESRFDADLLGGVTVIEGGALAADASDWRDALYRGRRPDLKPIRLTAVPYYAWDNRAAGQMRVWIPYL
jgi:DUF1680 family protein